MDQKWTVGVVLVDYHNKPDTDACLESLSRVSNHKAQIKTIVVRIVDHLDAKEEQEWSYEADSILSAENHGFSASNNRGMNHAFSHLHCDAVLVLNNDTRVHAELIDQLVSFAIDHKDEYSIFSPKIYFESGCEFHKNTYSDSDKGKIIWYAGGCVDKQNMLAWHKNVDEVDEGQSNIACPTDFCTGCCLLIPKKVFETVGQFDERYFLYWEDTDYGYRVRKNGGTCWYVPSAVLWHKNAGSTGGSGSELQQYYQTRNRLLFGMKYAPFRTKIALWREAFGIFRTGSVAEKEAIRDALLGRFGKRRSR